MFSFICVSCQHINHLFPTWPSVKEIGPIDMATGALPSSCLSSSPPPLNHIALVIIVRKSSDIQQDIRCTRVNELRVGRLNTDNHRWSLVNFLRTEEEKSCLNATRSSILATGRIRSTSPSSSSHASQRLHRKKYLRKCMKRMTRYKRQQPDGMFSMFTYFE